MRSGNMLVNMLNTFAVLAHQGLIIYNFAIRVYLFWGNNIKQKVNEELVPTFFLLNYKPAF